MYIFVLKTDTNHLRTIVDECVRDYIIQKGLTHVHI